VLTVNGQSLWAVNVPVDLLFEPEDRADTIQAAIMA
jgi:hypothetical protein